MADLTAVFRRQADDSKRQVVLRLDRGVDRDGGRLAPKKKRRRTPPGVKLRRTGGIFPLLRAGRVQVTADGFRVTWDHPLVQSYHEGQGAKQPPRRILGFSPRQLDAYKAEVAEVLVEEARRLGISRR